MSERWNGSGWLARARRIALYERDGWQCVYCGRGPREPRRATRATLSLDHLTPRSLGGDHADTNLVTACISCNSARGARPVGEYATAGALERIAALIETPLDLDAARLIERSLSASDCEES